VGSSTKQTSQLEKTRLLITALLFKESNTKQEYVLTDVGTSSLVLLDRPYGPQMQTHFANGWGVSVIDFGYGADRGLFELAVLDKNGRIHYGNPVSNGDVRGWLTKAEAQTLADEVASWQPDQYPPEPEDSWEEEE